MYMFVRSTLRPPEQVTKRVLEHLRAVDTPLIGQRSHPRGKGHILANGMRIGFHAVFESIHADERMHHAGLILESLRGTRSGDWLVLVLQHAQAARERVLDVVKGFGQVAACGYAAGNIWNTGIVTRAIFLRSLSGCINHAHDHFLHNRSLLFEFMYAIFKASSSGFGLSV